jgi:signal-transduction protein with cAMP-binding, CBS, and nucleotidyltransferase domain
MTSSVAPESLRKLKSFNWLTAPQLERLAQNMVLTKVRKKDQIFDQGQSANMIYLVISGIVACVPGCGGKSILRYRGSNIPFTIAL